MVKSGYFAYSIKKPLTEHFGEASLLAFLDAESALRMALS